MPTRVKITIEDDGAGVARLPAFLAGKEPA